jgi:hypothetical protein
MTGKHKKVTVQQFAMQQLRDARRLLMQAVHDLERADRIDALDAMFYATSRIDDAQQAIKRTLPTNAGLKEHTRTTQRSDRHGTH